MSFKRHRAHGTTEAAASSAILCTLPPTCNHHPTPIANSKDLEAHYATYHAHVCEEEGCHCVFPDARLLEIHQTECHDPLAAVRKDRGEKIFACHLATCNKMFLTPKARRLHLIQGHGYPKEYFFAVTNKGVGGLLKRWGDGASLVRGQWKPREPSAASETPQPQSPSVLIEEDDDDEEDDAATPNHTSQRLPPTNGGGRRLAHRLVKCAVPRSPTIRFGRGGKNGGFSNEQQARGGRSHHRGRGGGHGHRNDHDEMDVDVVPRGNPNANGRGRGRGGAVANGNADTSGHGQWNGRGGAPGPAPSNAPSDPNVLAYVPRGRTCAGCSMFAAARAEEVYEPTIVTLYRRFPAVLIYLL
ncbi:hypothetical protein MVEN_01042100 [Mycena venus]|uniref:C2H2-type domain-containing protein n=1 Tax=Mycena venus TaxID=2733690 RepID=A0A8H6YC75_9AGAR|nr:hypothetical protein MVEN_01042100 [Mycena venus]